MVNVIKSEKDDGIKIIESKPEIWEIKSATHLVKFYRWIQRHKIMPGDIVPKRVLKRYYRKKIGEGK